MSSAHIEWRDPIPKRGVNRVWEPLLEPLTAQPGKWAMVRLLPNSKSAQNARLNLRAGRYVLPPGEWEFTHRGPELFARYLGPNGEAKR